MLITYNVSQLVNEIKITLEDYFPLIELIGEVSEVRPNLKSGHVYFKLRDNQAAISCVLWKNLKLIYGKYIEEGKELKLKGRVTTYKANSTFYLHTVAISLNKEGDIKKYLKELEQKLAQEGMFTTKKLPINRYPKCIGIITSKDGAVYGDIKASLHNRYPLKIQLYDVSVQGSESISSIIKALEYFNRHNNVDFIIIARGGGSNDDLFHFNDETLVRTIYKSKIPIITAIGHELNSSLADKVAALSVVTPTASVSMIPLTIDLKEKIDKELESLQTCYKYLLYNKKEELKGSFKSLISPKQRLTWLQEELEKNYYEILYRYKSFLNFKQHQIKDYIFSLKQDMVVQNTLWQEKLENSYNILEKLSLSATLKRGFVLLQHNDTIIKSKNKLQSGEYKIEFYDGQQNVTIKPN